MLLFTEKGNLKFSVDSTVTEIGIRKSLTFLKRQIAGKICGKIMLKPLKFSKRLKDDRTDTNFIALLRMYFLEI